MSQYIVRPTSNVENNGGTTPATAATVLSYLGDNSDTTYVQNTRQSPISWVFGLGAPTIGAGEYVARAGASIRYKGSAYGTYTIGAQVYRSTDAKPTNVPSIYPGVDSQFYTVQTALNNVAWTAADCSSLRLIWNDNRINVVIPQLNTSEVFATIYTIAKASVTTSNVTEANSVYPTIPVTASATIDWEEDTYDWQHLRKVLVEVRIESGGTGAGTGTLVTQNSATTFFTSTGSKTVSITMPDALTNGTYKIYARTLRYRDDGTTSADTTSAWTAGSTLTMSAPRPATPTMTLVADNSNDTIQVNVTPIASTNYLGPYIYVERSDDDGLTWKPVRKAYGVAGTFATASTFFDYEAPRSRGVLYRAKVEATYASAAINSSLWNTSQAVYLNADTWNFKVPGSENLNAINVNVTGRPTETITEDLGVFRPLGRKYPVVVAGTLSGDDGELMVTCTTTAEWNSLKTIVAAQSVMLLESTFGWSKYIRLLSGISSDIFGTATSPKRSVKLSYVEVDMPAIITGQTEPTVVIPATVEGGTATSTYADFYDGGTSTSAYISVFDGGAAA